MGLDQTGRSEEQPDMFSSGSTSTTKRSSRRGPKHQPGTQALERLRDRIELAVKELTRLREEHQALQKELDSIRRHGTDGVEGSTIVFNESPVSLRKKIESYIATVDRCIEQAEAEKISSPTQS